MKKIFLKSDTKEKGICTRIYQATLLNRDFVLPLNVVIFLKTNLATKAQAHVILFSTDLELFYEKIIDYYSLRFQIEFNFRDAKQYWGLDDFMNVKEIAVTHAANLSFFIVNLSTLLWRRFRKTNSDLAFGTCSPIMGGCRHVSETIQLLP